MGPPSSERPLADRPNRGWRRRPWRLGLALVDGGRRVVVGDSNRYVGATSASTLTIVNTPAALAHRPADLGTIARQAPRRPEHRRGLLNAERYAASRREASSSASWPPK
jgi:hypothetical protein